MGALLTSPLPRTSRLVSADDPAGRADFAPHWPRRVGGLLALGIAATLVCLMAEAWLMLELLAVLPEGTADPAEIERLADIGKAIAGATGATLVVRGLLDRAAGAGRLRRGRIAALALAWVAITGGIYHALVVVTDAIVDSLPAAARQDAVRIALYRKDVQDGKIADPDYGPGSTLSDLQRVKAINAAIGLLDRERDYARRFEGAIRDAVEARKADIVRRAERESAALRDRLDPLLRPFAELAEGRPTPPALAAWTAYQGLWKAPPDIRAQLLRTPDSEILPAWPEPPIRSLGLGDVPPGLDAEAFGRFVAEAVTARRDAALWTIEDRVLTALDAANRHARIAVSPTQERQLVLAVVVPPLAVSFGAVGIIANATALVLLVPGLVAAVFAPAHRRTILRVVRPASVVVPWIAVAAAIAAAPPVPFADNQGFSRIARQARAAPDIPLWTDLWLRMIGVEAQLLDGVPGRD